MQAPWLINLWQNDARPIWFCVHLLRMEYRNDDGWIAFFLGISVCARIILWLWSRFVCDPMTLYPLDVRWQPCRDRRGPRCQDIIWPCNAFQRGCQSCITTRNRGRSWIFVSKMSVYFCSGWDCRSPLSVSLRANRAAALVTETPAKVKAPRWTPTSWLAVRQCQRSPGGERTRLCRILRCCDEVWTVTRWREARGRVPVLNLALLWGSAFYIWFILTALSGMTVAERLRAARKTYAVFTMTMIWRYKDSWDSRHAILGGAYAQYIDGRMLYEHRLDLFWGKK